MADAGAGRLLAEALQAWRGRVARSVALARRLELRSSERALRGAWRSWLRPLLLQARQRAVALQAEGLLLQLWATWRAVGAPLRSAAWQLWREHAAMQVSWAWSRWRRRVAGARQAAPLVELACVRSLLRRACLRWQQWFLARRIRAAQLQRASAALHQRRMASVLARWQSAACVTRVPRWGEDEDAPAGVSDMRGEQDSPLSSPPTPQHGGRKAFSLWAEGYLCQGPGRGAGEDLGPVASGSPGPGAPRSPGQAEATPQNHLNYIKIT